MSSFRRIGLATAALALGVVALPGCSGPNAAAGGAFGTIAGAATGAVIGAASGHPGRGAAIGAAVGGVGGAAIGRAEDRRDAADAAIAQASYEQEVAYAASQAVTSVDLVTMTHNGVSDAVIRSMLLQRGASVDLSPGGVIYLKQQGVSDDAILAAQQAGGLHPVTPVIAPPPPRRVTPVVVHEVHEVYERPIIVRPRYAAPCRPRRRPVTFEAHFGDCGPAVSFGGRKRF